MDNKYNRWLITDKAKADIWQGHFDRFPTVNNEQEAIEQTKCPIDQIEDVVLTQDFEKLADLQEEATTFVIVFYNNNGKYCYKIFKITK